MTIQEMWHDGCLVGETVMCCGVPCVVVALNRDFFGNVRLDQDVQGRDEWNIDELTLVED